MIQFAVESSLSYKTPEEFELALELREQAGWGPVGWVRHDDDVRVDFVRNVTEPENPYARIAERFTTRDKRAIDEWKKLNASSPDPETPASPENRPDPRPASPSE